MRADGPFRNVPLCTLPDATSLESMVQRRASKQGSPRATMPKLEHDPEKWVPVFGKRSCSTKKRERDDDSKKSHPALVPRTRSSHSSCCKIGCEFRVSKRGTRIIELLASL